MGYTFKSICIRNFKYITDNKPLEFDFMNSNIVILDGQNGYGKTTLFDAIEILLTGRIKHFNPSLQNRKTETLGTLANDMGKDIVITAILLSDIGEEMHIERKLLCKNEFKSSLKLNAQDISQDELYNKLHLSSSMFEIGTYISQSESLDFLQNKYRDRKNSVSSLLDDSEISDKIQALKSVQECIFSKVQKETEEKEKQIQEIEKKVKEIKEQADHIVINTELPGEDIRLFDDVEYGFDVIRLDQGVTYETVIQQLKQIEEFLENYDEFVRYKTNSIIRELQRTPKKLFMALFYQKEIELLKKKEDLINELIKSKELLTNYTNSIWSVDKTIFQKIKIDPEVIKQIETLLLKQKKEQSQLNDADKVLAQMTMARRGLIKEFNTAVEAEKFSKNKCPLCGTIFEDIDSAITETEQFIKNIHTDGIKIIEDLEIQIVNLFEEKIIPVLKEFLEENKILININDSLLGCKGLSVEKLQQLMDKANISEFNSKENENFDIEEFSQRYETLLKELKEKEVPNKIIFQEKQVELYKSIHNTYYHNKKPQHTVETLRSKVLMLSWAVMISLCHADMRLPGYLSWNVSFDEADLSAPSRKELVHTSMLCQHFKRRDDGTGICLFHSAVMPEAFLIPEEICQ